MPSVSKSKARSNNRTSLGAVKDHLNDVVKPFVSASAADENPTVGTVHRLENAVHSNVEECEAHSGSSGTGPENDDSVSINGSFSGESEDTKEKTASNIIDAEKREKIRLRNEKKHQRQRERRAQELHERCCSLLMLKKLESLSRQLVAMGFTSDRASVALKMNDGKLEESVVWLLEGNTEVNRKSTNQASERALNIDITDELAQIEAMETRYGWPKKDMERAVVSSEGDLQKAEEMVRRQQQESLLPSNKSEETTNSNTVPQLEKLPALDSMQQLKCERDQNYPNIGTIHSEPVSKYSNVNGVSDGSWHPLASNLPRNTFPQSASILTRQSTSANAVDAGRSFTGSVPNNIQLTGLREPLVMMQRPQYNSTRQVQQSTSISSPETGYESLISGGNAQLNQSWLSIGARNVHQQQQTNYQADYMRQDPSANLSETSRRQLGNSGSKNATSPSSPPLNVPSSLGLFSTRSNRHSTSSSPHVDWNHVDWYAAGQMPVCDYTSIDWTMDSNPLSKPKSQWDSFGLSSIWKNHSTTGDTLSGLSRGLMAGRNKPVGGSYEWTSPFGGNDVFSAPRQFVNSSTLW